MIDRLRFVSGLAADRVRRHGELIAENALLRQQLIVAHRKVAAASGGHLGKIRHGSRRARRAGLARELRQDVVRRIAQLRMPPGARTRGGGGLPSRKALENRGVIRRIAGGR